MDFIQATALADSYGRTCGRAISPADTVDYPMQIMSLLSDFQERTTGAFGGGENDYVNAAKIMLSRMIEAARETERAVHQIKEAS